jgi:iron complex transport system substrate-binding protein
MGVDPEWLVEQDYDVLFIADAIVGGYGAKIGEPTLAAAHREAVMAHPAFSESRAVKEGRVYAMSEMFAGGGVILSYPYLAKALHPDLFVDLDPVAIHQEYVTKFLRSDAVLEETGVYFYPLLK